MARNIFNSVKYYKPKKNVFDLTHDVKLTCKMGQLIPVMNEEVVPGDSFKISCETLLRLAPMLAPLMHRLDMFVHYFFCPYRLLWPNWENFITNTKVAGAVPLIPYHLMGPVAPPGYDNSSIGSLADFLGMPVAANQYSATAFHHAAYHKIWDEYYRDQNLQAEMFTPLGDGLNSPSDVNWWKVNHRCWEHDYFTASLPFAQKGDAVELPLGNVIVEDGLVRRNTLGGGNSQWTATAGPTPVSVGHELSDNTDVPADALFARGGSYPVESTLINDLRRAFRLQEWLEKNARAGTRYIENILAHFGVRSSDKRLDRPEYITGVKSPVMISEVLSTFAPGDPELTPPQGNMSGHGIGVAQGKYGKYFIEEHGVIMGLLSVMPKTAYSQGLPRKFQRSVNTDYYWPSFGNLGEQAVSNREVYVDSTEPDDTFGYVPRYSEYKFANNRVAGQFKSTLNYWHMGREFDTEPALNEEFVKADPTKRIFAVTDDDVDDLYVHCLNKVTAVRPMSKFGTPTI